MKIQYQCDFCSFYFDKEDECIRHEAEDCSQNPKTKCCTTYKYEKSIMAGTGKTHYQCDKNLFPINVEFVRNCNGWEFDEGYAHV